MCHSWTECRKMFNINTVSDPMRCRQMTRYSINRCKFVLLDTRHRIWHGPCFDSKQDEQKSRTRKRERDLEMTPRYHTIQFNAEFTVDVEISRKQPLERLRIRRGTRIRAQIKPRIMETTSGPFEVADLFFEDGTTTRMVPYACFHFVE